MKEILDRFNGLNVLVIGDVMIDAYLIGHVERISPEAPIPVLNVDKKDFRLGGAANVALNLVALGAKPVLCSVIGTDKEGTDLLNLLDKAGISKDGILRSATRETTTKTRVMAQGQQIVRIDQEQTDPVSAAETADLARLIIEKLLPQAHVVLFEDYDKGVITNSLIGAVVAACNSKNIKVVVDPKKRNFMHYKGVDLFKPNLKELKEGFKRDADPADTPEFEAMIRDLMLAMNLKNIMVTLSERGVMISDGKQFDYIPAHIRKIADVSGAGDTVISVASLCMAIGMPNRTLAQLANLAGGLVCEEVGVVPIDKSRLEEESSKL